MTSVVPIPGARIIAFDHGAADAAIARTLTLIAELRSLRRVETEAVQAARMNWKGPSRSYFEDRRGGFRTELDRIQTRLTNLVEELQNQKVRASQLQTDANADELRARARDLERLEELARTGV